MFSKCIYDSCLLQRISPILIVKNMTEKITKDSLLKILNFFFLKQTDTLFSVNSLSGGYHILGFTPS